MISNPKEIPDDIIKLIRDWEKTESSTLFGFITTGEPLNYDEISRGLVRKIKYECLKNGHSKRLDVLLQSSGGDADAAYQVINFLKCHCDELRIFIPDWAKSAATLICLGADEIWMSDKAELGPLDAQIPNPRDPSGGLVSALEQFRAMDYLKKYSFEMLDTYVNLLLDRIPNMKLKTMLDEATPFVTQLMAPLFGQVDPIDFGASYRALDIAMEYGHRIIKRYNKTISSENIRDLLDSLTWRYPSHSFVIDRLEAEELGLNVKRLTGEQGKRADIIVRHLDAWLGFLEEKK